MPERISLEGALDITVERFADLFDCSVMSEPDPNWRKVDAAGHEHYYAKGRNHYPTLIAIRRRAYFGDGERSTYIHHYKCKRCREWIYPGHRQPGRTFVAGLKQWSAEAKLKPSDESVQKCITAIYANEKACVVFPGGFERELYVTDVIYDDFVATVKLRG